MTNSDSSSRLILHADDLGMNQAVSDGIFQGFRHGLLTSASLLANAPDAGRALREWKQLLEEHAAGRLPSAAARARLGDPAQAFDLGVHLNLSQGRPLSGSSYPADLLDRHGRFPGIFALFSRLQRHGRKFRPAILAELHQQVQFVCDHGLRPAHLNGHQYVEMIPAVAEVVVELLAEFRIKAVRVARERALLRSTALVGRLWNWPLAGVKRLFAQRFAARMDAVGAAHADVFFGTAHAGKVDLRLLRNFLTIAGNDRLVEIGLHPGQQSSGTSPDDRADGWHDRLAAARPKELQMLVSAELPAYLETTNWRLGRLTTQP